MKKLYTFVLLLSVFSLGISQQDAQYSQYMFNGQVLNPAFAGSLDRASATLIVREQWLGMAGRPRTQSLSFNSPTTDLRHGLGMTMVNDMAGGTSSTRIAGQYAYFINISSKTRLSFGLQASLFNFRSNVEDLRHQTPNDPTLQANTVNLWRGNIGTGVYFQSPFFYAGLSAPELLQNRLSGVKTVDTREDRTYFGTAGAILPLGSLIKFKPSVLAKMHPSVPISFDFNGMFLFLDKFWVGASYRTDDAVVFLAELQITPLWRIGYAYDMTTSALKTYNSGSHEFMLGLDLNMKSSDVSPRYFR